MSAAMRAAAPLVTVVVPTRDAARTLPACLRSVRAQTHPAVELIVVDNWSADGTWELARRLADVALRGGPERSEQRNLGIARARGEWIMWIDADMELYPDVVERALASVQSAGAAGAFIPERSDGSGFWTACRTLERRCYQHEPRIEAPRLLRRTDLERTGGFRGGPGFEDAELRTRLRAAGARLVWADTLIVHHEGRLTLAGVARKRRYYGRDLPALRGAHPGAVSSQVAATLGAYWRHRRLLATDPAHAAGLLLLRAIEAGAYLAGAVAGRAGSR
jgi:glycosyltransferase involved in cell wall biosynthesis